MNGDEPIPDQPEAPSPPPEPARAPQTQTSASPDMSSRRLLIVGAVVIVLALGAYFIARSDLLTGGVPPDEAFTVETFAPPSQLITVGERVLAHARPDVASPTVVMFGEGAALDVNGRVSRGLGNDWYQIVWNGQTAYVRVQDTAAGEGAPPTIAERPEPEERPKPEEREDDGANLPDFPDATPAPDVTLSEVQWIRRPNARDFARFYPDRALSAGQSGRVVLDCVANSRGNLNCSVAQEDPPGWGFGQAAIRISRQARVDRTTTDGSSVEGRHVELPLAFRAGD